MKKQSTKLQIAKETLKHLTASVVAVEMSCPGCPISIDTPAPDPSQAVTC